MSCGSATYKCDTGYPLASGITGTLGFTGPQQCCRAPCPAFPIHHVKICIRINEYTSVKIQQGCGIKSKTSKPIVYGGAYNCPVDYNWGLIENSWGRSCRTVEWNRMVPSTSFIRIRLCSVDTCVDCERSYTTCGNEIKNQLLKFEVDQVDYTSILQSVAGYYTNMQYVGSDVQGKAYGPLGVLDCVHVTCGDNIAKESTRLSPTTPIWAPGPCCDTSDGGFVAPYAGVDLTNMRVGTEITFGPLGQPISGLGFI